MKRSWPLGVYALLLLAFLAGPASAAQPNIVIVITDDQPALDGRLLDWMPNVRSMFRERGVELTDFHSESPLCCPARAGYLTGQHTHNHGVIKNVAGLFVGPDRMTIATQLHGVGYHTMLAGKYLNNWGTCCKGTVPPGWDRFAVFDTDAYYDYSILEDGDPTPERHGHAPSDYSTDVLREKALAQLRSAPRNQPVLLWVAPYGPHSPNRPAPRYASTRCQPPAWAPPSYDEADVSDKPAYVRAAPRLRASAYDLVITCRTLLAVDDLVGALRSELKAESRWRDTLFVFAGDNGMTVGAHRLVGKAAPYATDVPLLLSWPAQLGNRSRRIDARLQNIDLAPTLCEIAGCQLGPYPNGQARPDGVSFAPLLLDSGPAPSRPAVLDEMLVGFKKEGIPRWSAVTTTATSPLAHEGCTSAAGGGCRWHYIEYATGERELYDVSNGPCVAWFEGAAGDPCELDNAVTDPERSDLVSDLRHTLASLRTERGADPTSGSASWPAPFTRPGDAPRPSGGAP